VAEGAFKSGAVGWNDLTAEDKAIPTVVEGALDSGKVDWQHLRSGGDMHNQLVLRQAFRAGIVK
jgi:hypothetical protein